MVNAVVRRMRGGGLRLGGGRRGGLADRPRPIFVNFCRFEVFAVMLFAVPLVFAVLVFRRLVVFTVQLYALKFFRPSVSRHLVIRHPVIRRSIIRRLVSRKLSNTIKAIVDVTWGNNY
jgi:hypothetical protein